MCKLALVCRLSALELSLPLLLAFDVQCLRLQNAVDCPRWQFASVTRNVERDCAELVALRGRRVALKVEGNLEGQEHRGVHGHCVAKVKQPVRIVTTLSHTSGKQSHHF